MKIKTLFFTSTLIIAAFLVKGQSYFNLETEQNYKCSWMNYFPTANLGQIKSYDYATVKRAFDSVSLKSGIEFNFPQGGCQQRAQIMSLILSRKLKIEHSKVWLFAPVDLDENDKRTLTVYDPNNVSPNNTISWNYHVAPVVIVKQNNKADTFVIDPSIQKDAPVLLKQWFAKIGNSNISKYTFTKPEKYFFNVKCCDNNGNLLSVINGCFYEFINPAKDNLIMEKGLAINDMAVMIITQYLQPLMQSSQQVDIAKLNDLKAIFGNATVLDNLFSQNISGSTNNTSNRYATVTYPELMTEARAIFNKRMLYWANYTTKLLQE